MKVFVTGAGKAPAIERYYVDNLNELGMATTLFAAQNIFFDYYEKNLLHKILFKAGLSTIYREINRMFKDKVKALSPDIIWVFKGMEIFPETLAWAKKEGIKLANYNTDNPFVFSGKGSGNENVTRSIGLYDLHLTYDRTIRDRIVQEFGLPVELLPFSFKDDASLYEECRLENEDVRVCFVGSPDGDRAAFLQEIARELPLVIYGPGWDKFITDPRVTLLPAVHGNAFWKALYRHRVQINFMRPHNPDSHNMRSFEVPGIGGIMLAPATRDHKEYFHDGEDVFLFNDTRECIAKARQLLALSPEKAGAIRARARLHSVTSGFSYQGRAKCVMEWFRQLHEKDSYHSF